MLYVFMYVCKLMKDSVSFDPQNTKFTKKIDECMRRVMHYIPPKMVQSWLKKSLKMCSVAMENFILFIGENDADFKCARLLWKTSFCL